METERIAKLETQVEGIKEDVKDLKADVKEVHSRITTGNREIMDKIDDMYKSITSNMAKNSIVSAAQHDAIQTSLQKDIKTISDRVDVLERWRWMIVGGAIVLGYLVGHMDFFTKLIN